MADSILLYYVFTVSVLQPRARKSQHGADCGGKEAREWFQYLW